MNQNSSNKLELSLAMVKVFIRISSVLVEEDMKTLEKLDQTDPSGSAIHKFLLAKIPNLGQIVHEELEINRNS